MYYPIHPFFGLSRKKYYIFKTISKKIGEITEVEHKIGKCIGKSIEKNLLLRNHQTHWNAKSIENNLLLRNHQTHWNE
jgi:hypothetical protein